MSQHEDLAGQDYWDSIWTGAEVLPPVNPFSGELGDHVYLRLHRLMEPYLHGLRAGSRLVEVGCGGSRWLPCFAKQFGFEVTGIDYSSPGCESSRRILDAADVAGRVVQADLFAPPDELIGTFDVAVSFGVVEHFSDTSEAIKAISLLLKPGGLMITEIPNMRGIPGFGMRLVNRPVFDAHRALTLEQLEQSHTDAGLEILGASYSVAYNPWVLNLSGLDPASRATRAKARILHAAARIAELVWRYEQKHGPLPETGLTSAYLFTFARRP